MPVYVVRRIPVEEAILADLFGDDYMEYSKRVGRLGPRRLDCCGFLEKVYLAVVPGQRERHGQADDSRARDGVALRSDP